MLKFRNFFVLLDQNLQLGQVKCMLFAFVDCNKDNVRRNIPKIFPVYCRHMVAGNIRMQGIHRMYVTTNMADCST